MFSLDPQQLEKTYKGLQRQLHPDKFSTGGQCGWVALEGSTGSRESCEVAPLPKKHRGQTARWPHGRQQLHA